MDIKPADVKKLRDQTGAGMMDCKNALMEAENDYDKAVKILKEKGLAAATKRSTRATKEGRIFTKITSQQAAILELTCETDFVAKNDKFIKLGKELADTIIATGAEEVTDKLNAMVTDVIATIKENMTLRKIKNVPVGADEYAVDYIHGAGNIGVIVKFKADKADAFKNDAVKEFAFDCALHAAAFSPVALSEKQIPAEYIKEQEEIFWKQTEGLDKPKNILEGIVKGKISKHFSEICFLNQPFVKDDKKKVSQAMADVGKTAGIQLEITDYIYFKLGE